MSPQALIRSASALICAALVSCASSTMDSIPGAAEMDHYKSVARTAFAGDYARLTTERDTGFLSQEEYNRQLALLDERVVAHANSLAWNNHELAEQQRAAQNVPTPSAPQINLTPDAMRGGAGGMSNYRSSLSQYNNMSGVGGSTSLSSGQLNAGSYSSGGGALATPNYPGSIYDAPSNQ